MRRGEQARRLHDAMRLVGRAAFDPGEFVGQESESPRVWWRV